MSVYLDRGVIPYSEGGGLVHKPSESLDAYQLVERGNFVLNNQQAWRGSVGVSKYRGIVSPAYLVFELSKDLDPDFANYQFRETRFVDEMMLSSQGVGDIQRQVKWPLLRLTKVFLPPLNEQRDIAAHLDRVTTRIEALVVKKTRFIELLREKRQALITHAVTKGLDAGVPMKDSGVEWLGKVPKGWRVMRLKHALSRNDGGVWGSDPSGKEDTIVLRSTEQTMDGRWLLSNPAYRSLGASEKAAATLEEGDLLVTKSSGSSLHIGKTTLVDAEVSSMKCCYSNFMQRLRTNDRLTPKLAWYVLNSSLARQQLDLSSNSSTGLANLNSAMLGNIWIATPDIEEQIALVSHLDRATTRIDTLIAKTERSIELLREHRSALITAAVTGKIDLRNAA